MLLALLADELVREQLYPNLACLHMGQIVGTSFTSPIKLCHMAILELCLTKFGNSWKWREGLGGLYLVADYLDGVVTHGEKSTSCHELLAWVSHLWEEVNHFSMAHMDFGGKVYVMGSYLTT